MAPKNQRDNGKPPTPFGLTLTPQYTPEERVHNQILQNELITNLSTARLDFLQQLIDPRRDIQAECGWPKSMSPAQYKELFDNDPIAARVVECLPKEAWKVMPKIKAVIDEEEENTDQASGTAGEEDSQLPEDGGQQEGQEEGADTVGQVRVKPPKNSKKGQKPDILNWSPPKRKVDGENDDDQEGEGDLQDSVGSGNDELQLAGQDDDQSGMQDEEDQSGAGADDQPEDPQDDKDKEENHPFNKALKELNRKLMGGSQYEDPDADILMQYCQRVHIQSRIGQYGVMLLGFDDGASDLSQPVEGIEEENSLPNEIETDDEDKPVIKNGRTVLRLTVNAQETVDKAKAEGRKLKYKMKVDEKKTAGMQLAYVRIFPEVSAPVTQWESNPNSPRYGQPVMYSVIFNDYRNRSLGDGAVGAPMSSRMVHWTRVIHVAIDVDGDEWIAPPAMQKCLPCILDLRKIRGSSAEGYWRNGFPQLVLKNQPSLGGDVKINPARLRDMVENNSNSLEKSFILMGMDAELISGSITDPTPHIDKGIEAICIQIGIPVPVFKGYEIGEQASENNDEIWEDRLRNYRKLKVTTRLVVLLIDRLQMVGVLPKYRYTADWPDSDNQSPEKKANVASVLTMAISSAITSGVVPQAMSLRDYLIHITKFDPELVDEMLLNAEKEQAMQEMENQQLADKHGMIPESPDGFQYEEEMNPQQQVDENGDTIEPDESVGVSSNG